jgi:hypothetical protein
MYIDLYDRLLVADIASSSVATSVCLRVFPEETQIGDSSKHWNFILHTILCYKFCACYHQKNWYFFRYNVVIHCGQRICYFQNTKYCSLAASMIFGSSAEGYLLIWVLYPPDIWTIACEHLGAAQILNFCLKCFDATWCVLSTLSFLRSRTSSKLTFPFTVENSQLYFLTCQNFERIRRSAELKAFVTTLS